MDVKHFYRVSLCVNAVLTSCLPESVRLSVTLVYCSQTITDIVKSSFFARYAMAIMSDLESWDAMGRILRQVSLITLVPFDPE